MPLGVLSRDKRTDVRRRLSKPQGGRREPPADDFHGVAIAGRRKLECQDGSFRRYTRVLRAVRCLEGFKALQEHREDVSLLPVKGNRLTLDRGPHLPILREVCATVRMMRVFDQMRCDLAA